MRKMVGTVAVAVACVHSVEAKTPTVVLQTPERVYAGETFTAKLLYQSQNTENPLPAPIFEVVSTGQFFHVSGETYTNRVWLLGLSTNAVTPGILGKKEKGELSFSVTAGDRPIAWNVILHEAGQGGDSDPFPLDRLFSPERLARADGVVEILKDNIGRTWGKFYTKFGDYLQGNYPIVYADFWKTASAFAEMVYFRCRESLSPLPSLLQASPATGKTLAAGSCSHRSDKSMPKTLSDDSDGSYDGTIWLYCPSCTTWKLCLKGAFGTSPEIYETLDWSQPVYVIAIDSKSVTTQGNYGELAAALLGKGTVLGACWTHGGNRNIPAKSVDHSAETVARHLKLLGADPTKITFIGTGYGAHVAANAIALYENDSGDARPFARLVAIDPLATDYGILSESAQASSNLFLRASGKCSLIDLYRSSWSRSLTRPDQLFGDYNFALWPEGGFYPKTLDNEWSRSDAALAWFIGTVTNSETYAHLGFNFEGDDSWLALTGATEPPPSGTFAGVIDGLYLELVGYVEDGESSARYAETMRVEGTEANVMETLFENLTGVIDYAVVGTEPISLDAEGKTVTFSVVNWADNLAIPYDALSIFTPKAFYPWRRGISVGVWLVDLTTLEAKVPVSEIVSADGAGLAGLLRANGWASLARRIGEVRVDTPALFVGPLETVPFSVPVRVRSDCFGTDRPLRETTLLLAAGVVSGTEDLPAVYAGDLDARNNFFRFDGTPAVVPFFAEVSLGGSKVAQGATMDVRADVDGSWTAALSGLQAEDTGGNALSYTFEVVPATAGCMSTVTPGGVAGAEVSGALADGLAEGRYTVSVTVGNGAGEEDTLSFTLVVTRDASAPGVSKDTSATMQDGPLTAYIRMLDAETPEITWKTNIVGRTYTVKGKASLSGEEEWVAPTNGTHRFFKVFADPAPVVQRPLP